MSWTRVGGIGRFRVEAGHVYVWCSGSNDVADWLRNADLRRDPRGCGARVNKQDMVEAEMLYDHIAAACDLGSAEGLTIAGFSRGGAIAQVLSVMLQDAYEGTPQTLLLFASKRAGNRSFTQRVIEENHHVFASKHRGDIVPALPPWPLYRNIKHRVLGDLSWPWVAHPKSAADAAWVRKRMGEGMGDVYSKG